MRNILIFSSFVLLSNLSLAQNIRTFETLYISAEQAIIDFSDSMRLSYPYHWIEMLRLDEAEHKVSYNITPTSIEVTIPIVWDEATIRSIYAVLCSLAQTSNYNNLNIVNRISRRLVGLNRVNGESADWQKEMAIKAALLDLKYSARLDNYPAVLLLPKELFTQDIINGVREAFSRSPFLSRQEAEIIAQRHRPLAIPDTTGFVELEQKRITQGLDEDEIKQHRILRWNVQYAESVGKTGISIEQYIDSTNRAKHKADVSLIEGIFWEGYSRIISNAGDKRIYSMAPLIDSFATPEIRQEMPNLNIDRILARLNYKDYPQKMEEKYLHIMDSCIMYLKNHPELDSDSVFQIFVTLKDHYDDMIYIGVPDIHYKLAPLLLITNTVNFSRAEGLGPGSFDVSIGAYFFIEHFWRDIKNMPFPPNDPLIEDFDKEGIPVKIYQWMLENKDNYQLDSRFLNDD